MKKKGTGIAGFHYPVGLPCGGDPSHASIKMKTDGTAHVGVGCVDIGQGCKTVLAQIAAEALGIPYENVTIDNSDTDDTPFSMGTFGSRNTYIDGKAVIKAAEEVRGILLPLAAQKLGVPADTLTMADGRIMVRDDPETGMAIAEACAMATFGLGLPVIGRGGFMKPQAEPDPETGALDVTNTLSYAAVRAEVEVDTETGVIEVHKLTCVFDVGTAINPLLVEGQIEGGAAMGLSSALMENLTPNYPTVERQPTSLGEYIIPTTMDMPELVTGTVEKPSLDGPYGAKGLGEVTANVQAPAIVSAVHDAIGIWFNELPITPERVLRAIREASPLSA